MIRPIEQLVLDLTQIARDWLTSIRLRREINRLKAQNFDLLADNVRGLRRVLDTNQRVQQDLFTQIKERDAQIARLRQEYTALEERLARTAEETAQAERLALFRRLQPIVTQLPAMQAAVAQGADISTRDVLDLLAPLDEMLRDLGFEVIGQAGEEVNYDPQRHNPVGRGARSVTPDDRVRVRYVGYLYQGRVICKAQVTRVE